MPLFTPIEFLILNLGMLIGSGEIIGGAAFGLLGSRTSRRGRDPIVIFGFISHMMSFLIIYLNLPSAASISETTDSAFIQSRYYFLQNSSIKSLTALIVLSVSLALFASFLLGLGDSCFNTQLYSYLSTVYSTNSASAFALFKFVQSVATSIAFIYSDLAGLSVHILVLTILSVIATSTFCLAEWSVKAESKENSTVPSPSRSSLAPLSP